LFSAIDAIALKVAAIYRGRKILAKKSVDINNNRCGSQEIARELSFGEL
jgi:hypothetical protein